MDQIWTEFKNQRVVVEAENGIAVYRVAGIYDLSDGSISEVHKIFEITDFCPVHPMAEAGYVGGQFKCPECLKK